MADLVETTSILASQLEFCCCCKLKHFWSLKVQVRALSVLFSNLKFLFNCCNLAHLLKAELEVA